MSGAILRCILAALCIIAVSTSFIISATSPLTNNDILTLDLTYFPNTTRPFGGDYIEQWDYMTFTFDALLVPHPSQFDIQIDFAFASDDSTPNNIQWLQTTIGETIRKYHQVMFGHDVTSSFINCQGGSRIYAATNSSALSLLVSRSDVYPSISTCSIPFSLEAAVLSAFDLSELPIMTNQLTIKLSLIDRSGDQAIVVASGALNQNVVLPTNWSWWTGSTNISATEQGVTFVHSIHAVTPTQKQTSGLQLWGSKHVDMDTLVPHLIAPDALVCTAPGSTTDALKLTGKFEPLDNSVSFHFPPITTTTPAQYFLSCQLTFVIPGTNVPAFELMTNFNNQLGRIAFLPTFEYSNFAFTSFDGSNLIWSLDITAVVPQDLAASVPTNRYFPNVFGQNIALALTFAQGDSRDLSRAMRCTARDDNVTVISNRLTALPRDPYDTFIDISHQVLALGNVISLQCSLPLRSGNLPSLQIDTSAPHSSDFFELFATDLSDHSTTIAHADISNLNFIQPWPIASNQTVAVYLDITVLSPIDSFQVSFQSIITSLHAATAPSNQPNIFQNVAVEDLVPVFGPNTGSNFIDPADHLNSSQLEWINPRDVSIFTDQPASRFFVAILPTNLPANPSFDNLVHYIFPPHSITHITSASPATVSTAELLICPAAAALNYTRRPNFLQNYSPACTLGLADVCATSHQCGSGMICVENTCVHELEFFSIFSWTQYASQQLQQRRFGQNTHFFNTSVPRITLESSSITPLVSDNSATVDTVYQGSFLCPNRSCLNSHLIIKHADFIPFDLTSTLHATLDIFTTTKNSIRTSSTVILQFVRSPAPSGLWVGQTTIGVGFLEPKLSFTLHVKAPRTQIISSLPPETLTTLTFQNSSTLFIQRTFADAIATQTYTSNQFQMMILPASVNFTAAFTSVGLDSFSPTNQPFSRVSIQPTGYFTNLLKNDITALPLNLECQYNGCTVSTEAEYNAFRGGFVWHLPLSQLAALQQDRFAPISISCGMPLTTYEWYRWNNYASYQLLAGMTVYYEIDSSLHAVAFSTRVFQPLLPGTHIVTTTRDNYFQVHVAPASTAARYVQVKSSPGSSDSSSIITTTATLLQSFYTAEFFINHIDHPHPLFEVQLVGHDAASIANASYVVNCKTSSKTSSTWHNQPMLAGSFTQAQTNQLDDASSIFPWFISTMQALQPSLISNNLCYGSDFVVTVSVYTSTQNHQLIDTAATSPTTLTVTVPDPSRSPFTLLQFNSERISNPVAAPAADIATKFQLVSDLPDWASSFVDVNQVSFQVQLSQLPPNAKTLGWRVLDSRFTLSASFSDNDGTNTITCLDDTSAGITGRLLAPHYIEFDLSRSQTWASSNRLNITCDSLYIIPSLNNTATAEHEQPSEIVIVAWLDNAVLGAVSSPYIYSIPNPTPKKHHHAVFKYVLLCFFLISFIAVSFFFIIPFVRRRYFSSPRVITESSLLLN